MEFDYDDDREYRNKCVSIRLPWDDSRACGYCQSSDPWSELGYKFASLYLLVEANLADFHHFVEYIRVTRMCVNSNFLLNAELAISLSWFVGFGQSGL